MAYKNIQVSTPYMIILLTRRFRYGQLIEINSHGLFSKWFSESGKLVVKMFQKIQELIDDPEALICILMDEVSPSRMFDKSNPVISRHL